MITAARPALRVLLYEGQGSQPLDSSRRQQLFQALLEAGYAVSSVRPDRPLCDMGHQHLIVLGLFGQGHPPLLEDAGGRVQLQVHDLGEKSTDEVVELVGKSCDEAEVSRPGGWKPWFPVIDFDRCTNCMQCLSFCLFDVYGATQDGKIQVQNQSNCKTDCPACSRVCPEVAILFPKYKAGPINGDEIHDEDLRREAMKVDISSLLGGDIYQMLRDRSQKAKSRFSKERDDERALKERQRCLKKLKQGAADMDIPPEVLASLPSADEIQSRAAQARRRAEAALAAGGGSSPETPGG